jgi:hypothetical protein
MSSHDEKDLLTQELRQRSAGIGGHPIGMDDVRGRARSIRRRRTAVRGAVAAVVLAIAAPVGLSVTDVVGSSSREPAPPAATGGVKPSESPSPSRTHRAPEPNPDGTFPLTVHGLPQGPRAAIPYVDAQRDRLVTADGTVEVPEPYAMITPYNGGYLAIGSSQQPGKVIMLDADLNVRHTDPAGGSELAVSDDRSHVAYTVRQDDDTVMLVNAPVDGTDPVTWMIDVPDRESLDPVGFLDDNTVVYNSDAADVMGYARRGEKPTPVGGLLRIDDASEATGMISGLVSYGIDGACSGVMDPASGRLVWKDCKHSNLRFSPDGRMVVADASYFDGPGSPTLTLMDASNGDELLRYFPAQRNTVVGVSQAAWEDDDTVLAYVDEGGDQAMLRLEVDGYAETVTDVVTVRDMRVEYWFAEVPR